MRIFLLEPTGRRSFLFFDTMEKTFVEHGHSFVHNPSDADVVLLDLWTGKGIFCKRDVDATIFWQKPVIAFDFFDQWGSPEHRPNWWGFDDCKILHEKIRDGYDWAKVLSQMLESGVAKLVFVRKMSKSWEYPQWVRPIECCVYPDHIFEPESFDDYCARPYDVCFIGNATPWRANAAASLSKHGINGDFFFPFHRIDHADWLHRHRQAKLFMEADGGGFGSERPYQLGCIAAMLKIRNDQRFYAPWTDMENCVEAQNSFWGETDAYTAHKISRLLVEPDELYDIYLRGINHLHQNYSAEARAKYILNQMEGVGLK